MPTVVPKKVRTSEDAKEMLRFDLDNENETIVNYRAQFANAKRSASSPWLNRSGKSWSRNKTIKLIWQQRWANQCLTWSIASLSRSRHAYADRPTPVFGTLAKLWHST